MTGFSLILGHLVGDYLFQNDWMASRKTTQTLPCLVHCCMYTIAVFLTCFWFLPWWAYVVVGVLHFPVDRWRLARKMMDYTGQSNFATGGFSPWSIIVVDNTVHLVVLWGVGLIGGVL